MGDVYSWYRQGLSLLESGNAHAAATVLQRAVDEEPNMGSLREGLARAYFRSGRFSKALEQFTHAIEIDPVNHYAYFGAGLSLGRLGRIQEAIGQLKIAVAMRPQTEDYRVALEQQERRRRALRIGGAERPEDESG